MPPNVVVDASVLVSAFLFPRSIPGRVVELAWAGVYTMHLSPLLLQETERALRSSRLRRTYPHSDSDVRIWIDGLRGRSQVFSGPVLDMPQVCRDPDDDHVLATSAAVGATMIVTGDKDLLALDPHEGIQIVTPAVALTFLCSQAKP